MSKDSQLPKYIAIRNDGMDGYSVQRFATKDALEEYISQTWDASKLEIFEVVQQKLTVEPRLVDKMVANKKTEAE